MKNNIELTQKEFELFQQFIFKEIGVTQDNHLLLNYDFKFSSDDKGNKTNSVNPTGMSGGALIELGNFSNPQIFKPGQPCSCRVVGMVIEGYKEKKVVLVVKLDFIVKQILKEMSVS